MACAEMGENGVGKNYYQWSATVAMEVFSVEHG